MPYMPRPDSEKGVGPARRPSTSAWLIKNARQANMVQREAETSRHLGDLG